MVDAFYYQEIYRSTIHVIYQIELGDEETEFGYNNVFSLEKHYVLNISVTKTLVNKRMGITKP